MKGLKDVDPAQQPNDLVVLLAVIGWVILLVYLISLAIDWVSSITWFI
jgi:hypothetical protein